MADDDEVEEWEYHDPCDDEEDEFEFDCGRLPEHLGGGCTMVGSEDCDWDCPHHDEVFGDATPTSESDDGS